MAGTRGSWSSYILCQETEKRCQGPLHFLLSIQFKTTAHGWRHPHLGSSAHLSQPDLNTLYRHAQRFASESGRVDNINFYSDLHYVGSPWSERLL